MGASANIVATSMLKRRGYRVSFFKFASIGFPFTIAATIAGAAFIWFVWGPSRGRFRTFNIERRTSNVEGSTYARLHAVGGGFGLRPSW